MMSHLTKYLLICGLLLCSWQHANAETLAMDNDGKYVVNTANIGKVIKNFRRPDIINIAIHTLGKGVDYVLDPANNQVRFKKPVQKYDILFCESKSWNPSCFETPQQLFAHIHQQNYANHSGYKNMVYLYFTGKDGKDPIQLIQNGSRAEYGDIVYEGDAHAHSNVWNHYQFKYHTRVIRKETPNENQEQIVSFNELALELLLSANKGNRLAKGALDKVNKGDKSTVAVQPKPTIQPKPPTTTQPKPSNPPAKPIATPKPTNPPAKPANPPKSVEPITSQHGTNNNPDTRIVQDWTHTTERDANGNKPDRCTWLAQNKHKYPKDAVKVTEKAWKCRRSRASKDGK